MFQLSLDNSLMAEIYPYLGFWAYLKFWFIDGINKQSLLLLDKTRVNYDSKKEEKGKIHKGSGLEGKGLTDMMKNFGVGTEIPEQSPEERAKQIANELNDK